MAADRYLRAGARWVFIVYALPLLVPLTLIALGPAWGAAVFAALSALLLTATVDTGRLIVMRGASGSSRALAVNEWTTTVAVLALVVLPWVQGGFPPDPSAFNDSLIIALAAGFVSTAALVMSEFDDTAGSHAGRSEAAERGAAPDQIRADPSWRRRDRARRSARDGGRSAR